MYVYCVINILIDLIIQLLSSNLAMTGCTIDAIEREAITGSGIKNVLVQNNR